MIFGGHFIRLYPFDSQQLSHIISSYAQFAYLVIFDHLFIYIFKCIFIDFQIIYIVIHLVGLPFGWLTGYLMSIASPRRCF